MQCINADNVRVHIHATEIAMHSWMCLYFCTIIWSISVQLIFSVQFGRNRLLCC